MAHCRDEISRALGVPYQGFTLEARTPLDSWKAMSGQTWDQLNHRLISDDFIIAGCDVNDFILSGVDDIDDEFWAGHCILTPDGLWHNKTFHKSTSTTSTYDVHDFSVYAVLPLDIVNFHLHWPDIGKSHIKNRLTGYWTDTFKPKSILENIPVTWDMNAETRAAILDMAEKQQPIWQMLIDVGQYIECDISSAFPGVQSGVEALKKWLPIIGDVSFLALSPETTGRSDLHSDMLCIDNTSGDIIAFVSKEFRFVHEAYRNRGIGQALVIVDEVMGTNAMNATSYTTSGYKSRLKAYETMAEISRSLEQDLEHHRDVAPVP